MALPLIATLTCHISSPQLLCGMGCPHLINGQLPEELVCLRPPSRARQGQAGLEKQLGTSPWPGLCLGALPAGGPTWCWGKVFIREPGEVPSQGLVLLPHRAHLPHVVGQTRGAQRPLP